MNKGVYWIVIICVFVLSCTSSKPASQKLKADSSSKIVQAAKPFQNSLLWKIERKDITDPSYLFGTIHVIAAEDYFFTEVMHEAFLSTESVVFELDIDEMNDMSKMFEMMGKIYMDGGVTLKDLITPEEYAIVDDHFKKMGLPLELLGRMKPMILSVFASMDDPISLTPNGMENSKSYELELNKMAKEQGKDIAGLETIEFQMSMFDSIPYVDQAKMLMDAIVATDAGSDQFQKMVDAYTSQNLDEIERMTTSDELGVGGYESLLLENRNINWIPLIESKMKSGSTFFAVGAGHLPGKKGVIQLLRDKGFKLTPVSK